MELVGGYAAQHLLLLRLGYQELVEDIFELVGAVYAAHLVEEHVFDIRRKALTFVFVVELDDQVALALAVELLEVVVDDIGLVHVAVEALLQLPQLENVLIFLHQGYIVKAQCLEDSAVDGHVGHHLAFLNRAFDLTLLLVVSQQPEPAVGPEGEGTA